MELHAPPPGEMRKWKAMFALVLPVEEVTPKQFWFIVFRVNADIEVAGGHIDVAFPSEVEIPCSPRTLLSFCYLHCLLLSCKSHERLLSVTLDAHRPIACSSYQQNRSSHHPHASLP